MSIQSVGMRAYSEAMHHFNKVEGSLQQGFLGFDGDRLTIDDGRGRTLLGKQ